MGFYAEPSPFDLSIDFDKDLGNPEIYDGFKFTVCSECGIESFFSLEQIRCMGCIDFALLKNLCIDCAFDLCGYEVVQ